MNHWIGVVSWEHVQRGLAGGVRSGAANRERVGFAQMNHGKQAPLKRMKAGDWLIYYSPRQSYPDGDALQAFTAIGRVRSGEVYPHDMTDEGVPGFVPWRIDIDYLPCQHAPIRPLIEKLGFIKDKAHWGGAFRFGQLKIDEADFALIAQAMGVER